MNDTETRLHQHHQKYKHLNQVRVDLYYTELAKSSNQSLLATGDVTKLIDKLLRQDYITSYIWVMAFTHERGLHAHVLLYLNDESCDALAVIATDECWLHLTAQEGFTVEQDIEPEVIQYLTKETAKIVFKANPECFIGIGK